MTIVRKTMKEPIFLRIIYFHVVVGQQPTTGYRFEGDVTAAGADYIGS